MARQLLLGTATAVIFFVFFRAVCSFMDPVRVALETLYSALLSLGGFGLGYSAGKRR